MFSTIAPSLWTSSSRLSVEACKRANPQGARNMATLKDIKLRIKSVSSIAKLTKTMQMVASSKLRSATRRSQDSKVASNAVNNLLQGIEQNKDNGATLVIGVTSDKGMCGPINNQVVRQVKSIARTYKDPSQCNLAVLGGKGSSNLVNEFPQQVFYTFKDLGKKEFSFLEVGFVVDQMLSKGNYENVSVVYNKFKNALTYTPVEQVIPGPATLLANVDKFAEYEFDEDEDVTFRDLFEFQIGVNVWSGLMENRASELAARMTSMDNATKNATSIISLLGIQYNRGRQAAITTELIEITSGASALEVEED